MKTRIKFSLCVAIFCLLFIALEVSAFYNPSAGRWLNRDPSGEKGGNNLFAFVGNHPTLSFDDVGLAEHHVGTMQLANSLDDGPGSDVLKKFTIPVADPHYFDKAHREYNPAIREYFDGFLADRGVTEKQFAQSAELAEEFVGQVMGQPSNSKIGGYLKSVGRGAAHWGGKALKGAVIVGSIFGAGAAVYSAYAGGNDAVAAANEYKRDVERGVDSATLDLDALNVAIAVQTMTGDYFVSMAVLGTLQQ